MLPMNPKTAELMDALFAALDATLNGNDGPRKTGFCLVVYPIEGKGICHWVTNSSREDVMTLLREQVENFYAPHPSRHH
jgi:hypothetical protein